MGFLLRGLLVFSLLSPLFFDPLEASQKAGKSTLVKPIEIHADEILRRADDVRCPSESYFMEVEISNKSGGDDVKVEVFTQGRERTRVNTIAPVRDRGRNMLMIGEDMWAYIPNLRRSVRIALNQKLAGQAAIGDVSRMRWWGDYNSEIVSEDKSSWLLSLAATKKGLTYEKVKIWVEKKSFRPLSAEYLSGSGVVLKKARFSGYRKIAGVVRPTKIEITDPHNPLDSSTLNITKLEQRESPERLFNQNNLK
ncbi:MAG: hypothetical protein RJB13_1541 [Pseudomonadota bacterium]